MSRRRNIPEIPSNLRNYILERDEYCCQKCGYEFDLEIHHITLIFFNGRNEINNLITLCHDCHKHCPEDYKQFIKYMNIPLPFYLSKIPAMVRIYNKDILRFYPELKISLTNNLPNINYYDEWIKHIFFRINKNLDKTFYIKRYNPYDNPVYLRDAMDFVFGELYDENNNYIELRNNFMKKVKPNKINVDREFFISKANEMINDNPSISFRRIGKELGINHKTVIKILNERYY